MSRRNVALRKRIIRLFKESGKLVMCTKDIDTGLKLQRSPSMKGKAYAIQPSMNQLSNVLKRHPEFRRTDNDAYVHSLNGGPYLMATWELTSKAEELK